MCSQSGNFNLHPDFTVFYDNQNRYYKIMTASYCFKPNYTLMKSIFVMRVQLVSAKWKNANRNRERESEREMAR